MKEVTYRTLKRQIKEGKVELKSDINQFDKVWIRKFGSKKDEIIQVVGNPEDFFTIGKTLGGRE